MIDLSGKVGFMGEFPDFKAKGFNITEYNRRFRTSNLIINATSHDVSYPKHWGPLSVKCAWGGREFYQAGNATYAVDESCFLVLDQDRSYSSWIPAGVGVESFTVNITPMFQQASIDSLLATDGFQLDNPTTVLHHGMSFNEQLYRHGNAISPLLMKMRRLAIDDIRNNNERLNELFVDLMASLVQLQSETARKIGSLGKLKQSTKLELYKRLSNARDYLYSVYDQPVDLDQTASVACLNQHYFLRQFRKNFGVTPHQFLTQRRMEVASRLFQQKNMSVVEVCQAVGYSDVASFGKSFKRYLGQSPAFYRQQFHPPGDGKSQF